MDTNFFPHFIRKNYPDIEGTNEEFIEIGEDFKKYLLETFKGDTEKLKDIWDISPKTVIMNSNAPFKVNGYNPALIIHFGLFVEKMKKQIEDENLG